MKKLFFALSLLASTIASAAVDLEITARFDQDSMTRTIEIDENTIATLQHNNGIRALMILKDEQQDQATLQVVILLAKEGQERELSSEIVTMPFGQSKSFVCPAHGVDAEIILKATKAEATQAAE